MKLTLAVWDEELECVEEYQDENGELVCVMDGGWRPLDKWDVCHFIFWCLKMMKAGLREAMERR